MFLPITSHSGSAHETTSVLESSRPENSGKRCAEGTDYLLESSVVIAARMPGREYQKIDQNLETRGPSWETFLSFL